MNSVYNCRYSVECMFFYVHSLQKMDRTNYFSIIVGALIRCISDNTIKYCMHVTQYRMVEDLYSYKTCMQYCKTYLRFYEANDLEFLWNFDLR